LNPRWGYQRVAGDHTQQFAQGVGNAQLSEVTHTYKWVINGCKLVQSDTGLCTIWLFVDTGIIDYDPSGNEIHGVNLYRDYAFSEWVIGTSVWNDYSQYLDLLAQSCRRVDYPDGSDTYFNCTTPSPDP
jgi:hypothetical protein